MFLNKNFLFLFVAVTYISASEDNDDHHNMNKNQARADAENFDRSNNSTAVNITFPSTAENFPSKGLPNTEEEDLDVVADQIPKTLPKQSSAKISDSQTQRERDCPLRNKAVKSKEYEVRVHVLPRAVPFNITILVDWRTISDDDKRRYHLTSDKLSIVKDKWSEFTVKVDNSYLYWKVIVSRDGEVETIETDFHRVYYFADFEVDILSSNVSWYVGEKNPHCDALIPTAAPPATTKATAPRTPITPSTTKTDVTVESTTDGVRASSELLENKGITNE